MKTQRPRRSCLVLLFFPFLFSLVLFCFVHFLVGLGFELRALHLQSRSSTAWATPLVHFALVILEIGILVNNLPELAPTLTLPISASQVAGITGLSHWHLAPLSPPTFFFGDRILLCRQTQYLPVPNCWDYRSIPPCPVKLFILMLRFNEQWAPM
jgi:hypothetical protein